MKFTRFLAPGSRELLDFRITGRAGGCPHCHLQGALVSHGYLRGHPAAGHGTVTRALRFFAPTGIQN